MGLGDLFLSSGTLLEMWLRYDALGVCVIFEFSILERRAERGKRN